MILNSEKKLHSVNVRMVTMKIIISVKDVFTPVLHAALKLLAELM